MKLLLDCTHVYNHPHVNSGIQRVVRNIISRLDQNRDIACALPVILKNNKIYEVKKLIPDTDGSNRFRARMISVREQYGMYYPRIIEHRPFQSSPNMRRAVFVPFKLGDMFLHIIVQAASRFCEKREIGKRIVELTVTSGDTLVLLDSSWQPDALEQLEALKPRGIKMVSVIYDLIPLTHPQFCDEGLRVSFTRWFEWVSRTASGFIAISKTIRDQIENHLCSRVPDVRTNNQPWFDFFHLGCELDLSPKSGVVRPKVKKPFRDSRSVYLMIGTIEPRKNHAFLLDAFEMLWQKDQRLTLYFAGKVGWKCDALIKRIKTHNQYNRRLFMFNDLSDTELEYCYQQARCLVLPACVEGFGLPLVEAMQRGLPAMASDIPVFHEIGGDFIAYFDLEKPEALAALVREYEATGRFPAVKQLKDWSGLTWDDSAKQFLTRIVNHLG